MPSRRARTAGRRARRTRWPIRSEPRPRFRWRFRRRGTPARGGMAAARPDTLALLFVHDRPDGSVGGTGASLGPIDGATDQRNGAGVRYALTDHEGAAGAADAPTFPYPAGAGRVANLGPV